MNENYLLFDSFDNFNKSRNSGTLSAIRSAELSKDGNCSYKVIYPQPKPQNKKNRLAQSLRNSKMSYYFSKVSNELKSRRRNFTELRFTFLSQSKKSISSNNNQIAHPSQPRHPRTLYIHRKTEERRSLLINRGRSIERITRNNPTARTNRAANSLDRNADLLSWNVIPESFKGMDFDTYVPMRKLGAGAHGSAYEVLHKSGQNIVTKFFGKEQKRFFRHEAAVLAQLKKISELLTNNTFEFDIEPHFEIDNYYCLNLVAGMGTLDDFIYFLNKKDLALNQQELLFIFEKLFESYLNLAKLNYAHRDIKPGNIILDPKDLTPKYIDYSLAACYGGTNQITTIAGTPAYLSPFLTKPLNKEKLISADLYSLGVTLLEVALPKINILSCNHAAKIKLLDSQKIRRMPILRKILKTLLWNSSKKFSILRKIYKQQDLFKNEDLDNSLEKTESDDEEAIDNFKPPKNENSCLAEKYLQDFVKFLKHNNNSNEEEKDSHKTSDTLKKNNEISFQEEDGQNHPLSLAKKAVKLFNSDLLSENLHDAHLLSDEIKVCLLGLDPKNTENKEYELILLNNLRFLSEKFGIESQSDQAFQKEVFIDHSEVIENLVFPRRRENITTASEFVYKDELIIKHPQILSATDNLDLIILKNYCVNEFEKMLKNFSNEQILLNKFKNFVSNNNEFSELLLSTTVNLKGHLPFFITFLDFADLFLNGKPSIECQKYIDEIDIIKKDSAALSDKFIENDLEIGIQEIKKYQLFYLMIGAVLYYHDQIPKTEKNLFDVEQKIQMLSKELNKDISFSFQPPTEQDHPFSKITNLINLCWKDEEAREVIYRYVYKYSSGSSKPDLIGLHLYKRPNYRLKDLSAWIDKEFEKLINIPDIYLELEVYIEKNKQTIEDLKNSLSLLTNLKKVKLHFVQPFKAKDKAQNKIEKGQYDESLSQTLEIISYFQYSLQLEIVFDFIYISPNGLEHLGAKICQLRQLKKIEIEFSYCPHITDESVKRVLASIWSSLELESLVFKLFACQKVMEDSWKAEKTYFICEPYSEHHSRAEIAGIVSQGFPLFL